MVETIKNWVDVVVKKEDEILLIHRQHDSFKGWIQPGGEADDSDDFEVLG